MKNSLKEFKVCIKISALISYKSQFSHLKTKWVKWMSSKGSYKNNKKSMYANFIYTFIYVCAIILLRYHYPPVHSPHSIPHHHLFSFILFSSFSNCDWGICDNYWAFYWIIKMVYVCVCLLLGWYTCYIHYSWVHNKSQGFASTATIKCITYYTICHLYATLHICMHTIMIISKEEMKEKKKASERSYTVEKRELHSKIHSESIVSAFSKISIWCSHGI